MKPLNLLKSFSSILLVTAILVVPFGYEPKEVEAAFPGDFTLYQEVTIDNTKVPGDLTDFPVYVDLSDLDVTGTDFWDTTSDCGDIRVTKSDGTTELAREVVSCNTGTKTGELHFKYTGTLSSTADTVVRIWYNGTDSDYATTATYGAENVWSDYELVSHSGGANDSTGNFSLSTIGSLTTNGEAGKIGFSTRYIASSNQGAYTTTNSSITGSTNRTLQAWADVTAVAARQNIMKLGQNTGNDDDFRLDIDETANWDVALFADDGSYRLWHTNNFTGGFKLVHAVLNGTDNSDTSLYVDGSVKTPYSTSNSTFNTTAYPIRLGYDYNNGTPRSYNNGNLDEVRIRASALTANWITTEYNNQNSPSTFYSVGTEQSSGGGGDTGEEVIIMFSLERRNQNLT